MSRLRTVLELALGDFRERARRYSFLLTLGAAAYLAYTVHAGWWLVRIGEYAPASGPVRLGMLVAQATGIILSLVGFYVVRGSVERDRRTGVGQILAATPATRLQYAAAKFTSNLAVLGAMLLVLAALAVLMAWWRAGFSVAALWQVGAPTLLVAFPTLALVAGLAVLFDSVPWLRGAAGNVSYFFLWSGLIGASVAGSPALDLTGYALIHDSLSEALAAAHPDVAARGLTVQLRPGGLPDVSRFEWSGVSWSAGTVAWRLYWVAAGAGLAGLATLFLRVFDPFGDRATSGASPPDEDRAGAATGEPGGDRETTRPAAAGGALDRADGEGGGSPAGGFTVSGLAPPRPAPAVRAFLRTVGGELRLLLTGHAWWWYGLVAAANAAAFLLPAGTPPQTILLVAWLLPVSAWSSLGCRERQHGTEQMLFSSPGPRLRQLPAQLAAGAGLSLLTAAGPVTALALGGDLVSLAALGAGSVFVPALALCLGAWSGSTRPFEALYVVLWYMGPVNGVPFLDFMGATGQAVEVGATPWFAVAAAVLALLAWPGRGRQLSAVG